MSRTLADIKREADDKLKQGDKIAALKGYRLVLEGAPLDFDLRMEIADLFTSLDRDDLAADIHHAAAEFGIKFGKPLLSIVAVELLARRNMKVEPLVEKLATTYCEGSSKIGQGIKIAPENHSAKVRDEVNADYEIDTRKLLEETGAMAADLSSITRYPEVVPPVPIFSTLDKESFVALLGQLTLRQYEPEEIIIRQGDEGKAVYFLADGEVSAIKTQGEREICLARLGPGSIFGEMALISTESRSASIICDSKVAVLELRREQVEELSGKMANVALAMAKFTRDRMINNLLATNPLFCAFDLDSKKMLLSRFTGHEVPRGTIFLEQETPGKGLYILLQGRAEILKWDGGEYIKLAEIGPGEIVGEISLLKEAPVTATVRTLAPSTLLFLARELFQPLLDAVPEMEEYFKELAQKRLSDTQFKMMQNKVSDDDFIEELDEDTQISDDEILLL